MHHISIHSNKLDIQLHFLRVHQNTAYALFFCKIQESKIP